MEFLATNILAGRRLAYPARAALPKGPQTQWGLTAAVMRRHSGCVPFLGRRLFRFRGFAFGLHLGNDVLHLLLRFSEHFLRLLGQLVGASDGRFKQRIQCASEPRKVLRRRDRSDAKGDARQESRLLRTQLRLLQQPQLWQPPCSAHHLVRLHRHGLLALRFHAKEAERRWSKMKAACSSTSQNLLFLRSDATSRVLRNANWHQAGLRLIQIKPPVNWQRKSGRATGGGHDPARGR
jgi:hypothetical protein